MLLACSLIANTFAQPVIKAQKDLGGRDFDFFASMALTKDGGRIVGGTSRSNISGNKTENSRGIGDYWIVKLDSANKIQFDKTIGGSDNDGLTALQQTSDGGYILGGGSTSNASGEKTQNSKGGADFWIVKLDSRGNIQFDKTIGGSNNDGLTALQQTSDGGYILAGDSRSNKSGNKSENSRGGTDYWIVKLDGRGNIQWDKTYGGSDDDFLTSLQQTTDGGYILGGLSFSNKSGEKSESSKGRDDFWVIKVDGNGNIQFEFSNASFEKSENARGIGDDDFWIVKLDKNGNKQFDKTIGGTNFDECFSIKEKSRNHYVAGGQSLSDVSGDKTSRSKGLFDYWIVDVVFKTATQTVEATTEDSAAAVKIPSATFFVYPNPAKDVLHIRSGDKATISLTDVSGKAVLTQNITGNADVNISSLQPGIYFLKNQTTNEVRKVVIEK